MTNKRQFAAIKGLGGVPDGATVDADGRLWSAIAGGGKLVCFNSDGSIQRRVEVPVPIITSVMFGGDDLDVLYATSIGTKALGMEAGGFPPVAKNCASAPLYAKAFRPALWNSTSQGLLGDVDAEQHLGNKAFLF